jgi:hypothetical protein
MSAQNVDLVLLVDSSESMRPCFGQLKEHLKDLLFPIQAANLKIRFGLVAYAAGRDEQGPVYDHTFICGSGPEMMQKLYSPQVNPNDFFTSDPSVINRVLGGLEAQGNEDTLMALDIAADFPFGAAESTRRVIAVFTDEPLEAGISERAPLVKIPDLIQKLMARRIQLFVSAPASEPLEQLGSLDRAEIEAVSGGDGLKSVDFKKLLAQMGKSISIASLQLGPEPAWKKALFGQDRFPASRFSDVQDKSVILRSGEIAGIQVECGNLGVLLDVSPSMTRFLPSLRKEISRHFHDAVYREVGNCRLSYLGRNNLSANIENLRELIQQCRCDGIYWFSDFQDLRDERVVAELQDHLQKNRVKLYIRSTHRDPSDLIQLCQLSGGGYKNGPPELIGT